MNLRALAEFALDPNLTFVLFHNAASKSNSPRPVPLPGRFRR